MKIFEILYMLLIKIPPNVIYKTQSQLEAEGLEVKTRDLITHYLASEGEMHELVELVSAINRYNLEIDMPFASALVLSDRDTEIRENLNKPAYRQKYLQIWNERAKT